MAPNSTLPLGSSSDNLQSMKLNSFISFFLIYGFLVLTSNVNGQRIGYVNTKVIYEKLPEFQAAEKEIDNLIANWNKEIATKEEEQRRLMQAFEMDAPMLTEGMREKKLKEIRQIEQELREFQNKRFGYKGMLSIKQEQLITPIKEKVYKATERVSKIKRVDFLFDVASDLSLPYVRASKDYTDFVLEQLGIKIPDN